MADKKARFVALAVHLKHLEAKKSQFFVILALTLPARSRDLVILVWTTTTMTTNRQTDHLPLLRMRVQGNYDFYLMTRECSTHTVL